MNLKRGVGLAALLVSIAVIASAQVPAACTGITFTRNLKLGSKGDDVKCLQALLNTATDTQVAATGAGSPGAETTYFGPKTKAAVIKFQEKYASEILAPLGLTKGTGFVGSATRAKLNSLLGAATGVAPVTGLQGGEGILTVSKYASPASGVKTYEGEKGVAVLGIKVKAQNSDIALQRIKVNLGTIRPYYYLEAIALYDGDNVVKSVEISPSTVYKSDSTYYVDLAGLNLVVKSGTEKVLKFKVDVLSSISRDVGLPATLTIGLDANAVRGVDAVGLNQYAPTASLSNTFTIETSKVSQAKLSVSKDPASPLSRNVGTGSDGDIDGVELLRFRLKAENDSITVTALKAYATGTAVSGGKLTTAYLYVGDEQVDSANVASNGEINFDSIAGGDGITIAKDSSKTLTIKVDIRNASSAVATATVSVNASNITAENSRGVSVSTKTGSAQSDVVYIYTVAADLTPVSTGWNSSPASGTEEAVIKFKVTAVGGKISLAKTEAISAVYATSSAAAGTTKGVSIAYTVDGGVEEATEYVLEDGREATVEVHVVINKSQVPTAYLNNYIYVTLTGISWTDKDNNASQSTTWVADLPGYKTSLKYLVP